MPAATITCYIQPCAAKAAGTAWVDTSKTAVVRKNASSKKDAIIIISDAVSIAKAIGGEMVVKTIATSVMGERRPAGVKALQGVQVVS